MQVRPRRDALARDLEEGCRPECLFKFLEIGKAALLRRFRAQQRPEGSAVNGATGGVIPDGKDQGLDVGTPACFLLQVETAQTRSNEVLRAISDPLSCNLVHQA